MDATPCQLVKNIWQQLPPAVELNMGFYSDIFSDHVIAGY